MKNFITLLEKRKIEAPNTCNEENKELTSLNANDQIQKLINNYIPNSLTVNDVAFHDTMVKKMEIYLAAFQQSLKYIKDTGKTSTKSISDSKIDIDIRTRIVTSPYYYLIYSKPDSCPEKTNSKKNNSEKNDSENSRDEINDSENSHDEINGSENSRDEINGSENSHSDNPCYEHSISEDALIESSKSVDNCSSVPKSFSLNIGECPRKELKPLKHLEYLDSALRRTAQFCPYNVKITLPKSYTNKDGTPNKRKKVTDQISDFEKYKDASGNIAYELDRSNSLPFPLRIFNDDINSYILQLGGPFVIEYFNHIQDVTYNNKNIRTPSSIIQFYTKLYKHLLDHRELIEEESSDKSFLSFNYFALEAIFNGSFFMYFCNLFSSKQTRNIVSQLRKQFPQGKDLKFYSNLYNKMNRLENPFLKHEFLKGVVIPTYYSDYTYNEDKQSAGKKDFKAWQNNILEYCDSIVELEKKVYDSYLILPSHKDSSDNNLICTEYCRLFNDSGIIDREPKRGANYNRILLRIVIDNLNYYPLWENRGNPFCK